MTDRPIIFSAPMVLALLAGKKTMTRRLAWRPSPYKHRDPANCVVHTPWMLAAPGDRLWVRENLICTGNGIWRYAADDQHVYVSQSKKTEMLVWAHHEERATVPSIHMHRWASRITLVITATKIERLLAISEADKIAEGQKPGQPFGTIWKKIHGEEAWDANPEVVAMTFKVHRANIDAMEKAA